MGRGAGRPRLVGRLGRLWLGVTGRSSQAVLGGARRKDQREGHDQREGDLLCGSGLVAAGQQITGRTLDQNRDVVADGASELGVGRVHGGVDRVRVQVGEPLHEARPDILQGVRLIVPRHILIFRAVAHPDKGHSAVDVYAIGVSKCRPFHSGLRLA